MIRPPDPSSKSTVLLIDPINESLDEHSSSLLNLDELDQDELKDLLGELSND